MAVGLGLAMPGLGHLYVGELRLGLSIWLSVLVVAVGLPLVWARWLFVPVMPAVVLACAWIAVQAVLTRDLLRRVRRDGAAYRLRPFNHPLTYLAFALGLGVLPLFATWHVVAATFVGSLAVRGESMFPKLLPGDHVLYDRSAFRTRTPEPGELVVVAWPSDDALVTRVIATAGHTVHLREGRPVVDGDPVPRQPIDELRVPRFGDGPEARRLADLEGFEEDAGGLRYVVTYDRFGPGADDPAPVTLGPDELFVLGDNRHAALADRHFGRVPLEAVVGGPRYVWASVDADGGLRGGRVGWNVAGSEAATAIAREVDAAAPLE